MNPVTVVGAGLAGSEAAWQLAIRGIDVRLVEMKPKKMTPAHVSPWFAELVCSNSLRSDELTNAVGLLKEELRRLGSLIMLCADGHRVAAGGALAVDREGFARAVTEHIRANPHIEIVEHVLFDVGLLLLSEQRGMAARQKNGMRLLREPEIPFRRLLRALRKPGRSRSPGLGSVRNVDLYLERIGSRRTREHDARERDRQS